jgi:hypothetical protein
MKNLLKFEEFVQFAFATVLFYKLGFAWWVFPAVILLPDISMVGYLVTPYWGAITYNFIHHKALGILIYAAGLYFGNITIEAAGLVLFAHSAMDRIFGYGLKYTDSFKNTHLGNLK